MDPYLEGDLWTTVHAQLAAEVARQLSPRLRPRYVAWPQKYYLFDSGESVAVATESAYPDVGIAEARPAEATSETVATARPVRLAMLMPRRLPHVRVEIRDARSRRLVTGIEFLSPTNKRGAGRRKYLRKRQNLLAGDVHLLEIDLLRKGKRLPVAQPLPPADYYAFLSRAELQPLTDIWPIRLEDKLPTVPVPLLPPDADVPLNLQDVFTGMYDVGNFDLAIDYSRPPDVPLSPESSAWANQVLHAAGLRR